MAQRRGRFEQADGGTLFLDEIGDMAAPMQAKLLRVLQDGEIARVGGTGEIKVDVRVISATNHDLDALVADGRFREDLYYRINTLSLRTPALREHPQDIPALAAHFAAAAVHRHHWRPRRLSRGQLEGYGHRRPGGARYDTSILRHRRQEAIPAPRHGGNVPGRLRHIAQHLAEGTNGDAHHGITHGSLGPDRVEQFVFRHQAVRVRHQVVQHGKDFGGQGYGLRRAPQAGVLRVEPKGAKDPLERGEHGVRLTHWHG